MRLYFLYFLGGLATFWIILFLYGLSSGFANPTPIIALVGSMLLFVGACPILVINRKIGLIIGIIGSLLTLPFLIRFTVSLFEDDVFNWGVFIAFSPILLISLGLFYSIYYLKNKTKQPEIINPKVKGILILVPIALFILYFLFFGKYWSWQMFGI